MKLNTVLTQQLKEGKIAIDNRGNPNIELLRKILEKAFPEDGMISDGSHNYYAASIFNYPKWTWHNKNNLPTVPLLDFIQKEEFTLPKFWHVVITKENINELSKWRGVDLNSYIGGVIGVCSEFPNSKNHNSTINNSWGYSEEITFEQFKKYVLKKNNMKEKEIIGYKAPYDISNSLSGEITEKGALYINHAVGYCPKGKEGQGTGYYLPKEIVETWEPVFSPKYTLPEINGYNGKLENELIIYGCAKFNKHIFEQIIKSFDSFKNFEGVGTRQIKSIKLDSNVEITKEQAEQIYNYVKNC